MNIPIAKPFLTKDEAQAAYDTILTGWITQGPKVTEFEEKFANYTGANYAVAVSNCTTALHLSLIVAGIKEGDEVICPSMSYIATANAIKHVNAKPVYSEVGEDYNIDIEDVKKKITPKTKAIIIVHQIGMPADIDAFLSFCKEENLILIEDAACAIGSSYKGQKIGSHSDLVCFSFHPRKVISTGDGGMITTSRKDYAERLKLLRQHGMNINDQVRHSSKKVLIEEYVEVGYNYRMTDIQASVGIKQLEKLDWIIKERRKIANLYYNGLKDVDCVQLPIENENCYTNYQSYSIILKGNSPISRNDLMQKLLDVGISTRRGVMLIHREKPYFDYQFKLKKSEDLSDNSIIIPLYVGMSVNQIDYVIDSLKLIINKYYYK